MNIEIPDYSEDEEKVNIQKLNNELDDLCNLRGWNQFFLKDQLKRSLREAGFERPSEVQTRSIPIALDGKDLICQAKSGMGKTAVFVISILQMLREQNGQYPICSTLVVTHTRQLSHQIYLQFVKFSYYMRSPPVRIGCFFGGTDISVQIQELHNQNKAPHIIVGTPGRLLQLIKKRHLNLRKIRHFVLDQCDKMLQNQNMRKDVIKIYEETPESKQVIMLSATFPDFIKKDVKNFMRNQSQIFVDPGELTLEGLKQYYLTITENRKPTRLVHLLDTLTFNQAILFVNTVSRAKKLANLMNKRFFNCYTIHSGLNQEQRIKIYDQFRDNQRKILVATDLFGRGIDIERVNLVINFDFPENRETYLHRVGRAGRFGSRGIAINFVNPLDDYPYKRDETEEQVLRKVQEGFRVKIDPLPKTLDIGNEIL